MSTPDAIALLRRLQVAAESGGRNGAVIEILDLLAMAHDADGGRPAAIDALERALARAEPEGYVRVFLDVTPELLAAVPMTSVGSRHARVVLSTPAALLTLPIAVWELSVGLYMTIKGFRPRCEFRRVACRS